MSAPRIRRTRIVDDSDDATWQHDINAELQVEAEPQSRKPGWRAVANGAVVVDANEKCDDKDAAGLVAVVDVVDNDDKAAQATVYRDKSGRVIDEQEASKYVKHTEAQRRESRDRERQ